MPRTVELLRACEAGGPTPHDRNSFACAGLWRHRPHPPFAKGVINDGKLDLFDGHWIVVDAKDARRFAGGGTYPAGKLWEVIRGMEDINGLTPAVAIGKVIPVRNDVSKRAPFVAEGDATIHTPSPLLLDKVLGRIQIHLLVIFEPFDGVAPLGHFAANLKKSSDLTHLVVLLLDEWCYGSLHDRNSEILEWPKRI